MKKHCFIGIVLSVVSLSSSYVHAPVSNHYDSTLRRTDAKVDAPGSSPMHEFNHAKDIALKNKISAQESQSPNAQDAMKSSLGTNIVDNGSHDIALQLADGSSQAPHVADAFMQPTMIEQGLDFGSQQASLHEKSNQVKIHESDPLNSALSLKIAAETNTHASENTNAADSLDAIPVTIDSQNFIANQQAVKAQVESNQKAKFKDEVSLKIKENVELKDGETIKDTNVRDDGTGFVVLEKLTPTESDLGTKVDETMEILEFDANGMPLIDNGKQVRISLPISEYRQALSYQGLPKDNVFNKIDILDNITTNMLYESSGSFAEYLKGTSDYQDFKDEFIQEVRKPTTIEKTINAIKDAGDKEIGKIKNFVNFVADIDVSKFARKVGKQIVPKKILNKVPLGIREKTNSEKKYSKNSLEYTIYSVDDACIDIDIAYRKALGKTQKFSK